MFRLTRRATKRNVTIRRRPSDFGGREPIMLQGATCATCCCCCLHWIGAGIGGTWGIAAAWRGERKRDPPIHPTAKRCVGWATLGGVVGTAGLLILLGVVADSITYQDPGGAWIHGLAEVVFTPLAFLPSLALLPVGAAAMCAALLVKLRAATISDTVERARMRAGMRLAWRITWKSFVWATFASGFGYLVMYVIALFMD
jgi:hypothetical protein